MSKSKRKKKRQGLAHGCGDGMQLFGDALADEMTKHFQQQLRQSPLWAQMVGQYGHRRAEELLQQCRADVRPGPGPSHFSDNFSA